MLMTLCALSLGRLVYGLLLPGMRHDLHLTRQQAGNLGTATSMGYLLFVVPAGYVASRFGPRASILAGLLVLAIGFAALALSDNFYLLAFLIMLLGLGTALLYTPVVSMVVGWFPHRRGSMLGLANSGIGIGVFVTGFYVPWLMTRAGEEGWRVVWMSFAIFTALVMLAAFYVVRNPPGSVLDTGVTAEDHAVVKKQHRQQFFAGSVYRSPAIRLIAAVYAVLGFTYIVQAVFIYSYALESGVPARVVGGWWFPFDCSRTCMGCGVRYYWSFQHAGDLLFV